MLAQLYSNLIGKRQFNNGFYSHTDNMHLFSGNEKTGGFFVKWLIATMLLCLVLAGTVSGAKQAANNTSGCVGCSSDSAKGTENQTQTDTYMRIPINSRSMVPIANSVNILTLSL